MLTLSLILATVVSATSLNCRGSAVCSTDAGAANAAQIIHDQISNLIKDGGFNKKFQSGS